MKSTQLVTDVPGNRRTRTTETGSDAGHETDATTRQRVAQAILEAGPSSAAELAERLGLSAAGVRRHLDVLTERGLVEPRERRVYGARGRGRPAKVFALTDAGRADFFQAYDTLAIQALDLLAEQGGAEAIGRLGRRRLAALSRRFDRTGAADPEAAPAQRLADALTAEGYVASVRPAAAGEQLCQHHCPVAHVAERYPQLCEAETELFSELLGVHVQRLATIAHGDGVCTTHVPRTAAESTGPAERETEHEPQQDTRHDTQQGRQSI